MTVPPATKAKSPPIKRYLAIRTDKLPWLFVSERGQLLTRQAVNYLIGVAAESAGLKNVHPHTLRHLRLLSGRQGHGPAHHAGAIHAIRCSTPAYGGGDLRGCGSSQRTPAAKVCRATSHRGEILSGHRLGARTRASVQE